MKNKLIFTFAVFSLLVSSLACGSSGGNQPPAASDEQQPVSGGEPSTTTGSNDLQFAPKDQVVVTLGDSRITEDGVFVYTVGSVVNNTKRPISGMVRIDYLDKDGNPIDVTVLGEEGAYDTVTFFAPIAPGETGYFDRPRDLSKLPVKPASARVSLEYAVLEAKSPLAQFSDTSWSVRDGSLVVSGKVSNTGDAACIYPSVYAVLLSGGKAVGTVRASFDPETENLEPRDSANFATETITDYLPGFDDVTFVIECASSSFAR